jgi:hypothetical protein
MESVKPRNNVYRKLDDPVANENEYDAVGVDMGGSANGRVGR